jgi:hypothetical protein
MAYEILSEEGGYEILPPEAPKGAPMSRVDKFATGAADPIHGGAQLLTKMLPAGVVNAGNSLNNWLADKTGLVARLPEGGVDQQVREREAAYQQKRQAAGESGFDGYRVLGNVASPANIALASRLPVAASFGGRVATGVGGGAVTGAFNPVTDGDFAAEKGKQIGMGAAFGGAVPALTGATGRIISPNASRDPNLALLRREGVQPTIGQSLGGWANRVEEKAMSVPIVGDAISHSREVARRQFNEAAINRATAPIGVQSRGVGQGAVQNAGDNIGAAYDAARTALGSFQLDQRGLQEIGRIRTMVTNLPEPQQRSFQAALNSIATDVSPNGTIPAAVFKRIDSKLGQDAARFSGSADPYHQQLGDALTALQQAITGAGRRANPQADAMFTAADRAYANLVRVEGASKAAMNAEGVFTPGQLNMAVRQADRSVRDRATARGTALMQDLGNAGQQVLGNKVPNSGTADRLMLGAGGLGAYFVDPLIPMGLLGGAAMYTQPMQGLLRGAVASRPQGAQAVANSLRQASPALVPLGAQVGLGLLN